MKLEATPTTVFMEDMLEKIQMEVSFSKIQDKQLTDRKNHIVKLEFILSTS